MYSSFYRRAFLIATCVILGYALIKMTQPFWGPLGWAAFLAFFLHPLHVRLARRLGGRAGLSAGLITGLMPLFLLAPLSGLGVIFARQVGILITHVRSWQLPSYDVIRERFESFPLVGRLMQWIGADVSVTAEQVQNWLVGGTQSILKSAASVGGSVALGVFGTLVSFALMVFLLFFLLRDGPDILGRLMTLVPMEPVRRRKLIQYLAEVTRAVVYGHTLTALAQGVLVGIGFAIVGLPSPLVFGVLAAIASLLPGIGSGLVLIPAVLSLVFTGRWGAAIFLAIWSVAISVADNLLRPFLARQHAAVSTLVIFIGVIGGIAAFGVIGLVLGPVLLSLIVALLRFAEEALAGSE